MGRREYYSFLKKIKKKKRVLLLGDRSGQLSKKYRASCVSFFVKKVPPNRVWQSILDGPFFSTELSPGTISLLASANMVGFCSPSFGNAQPNVNLKMSTTIARDVSLNMPPPSDWAPWESLQIKDLTQKKKFESINSNAMASKKIMSMIN